MDLIPLLSYVILRGRCRYCHQPISAQYFLIELAAASLFAATSWYIGHQASLTAQSMISSYYCTPLSLTCLTPWILVSILVAWTVMALLIALFVYDWHWGELPNWWTLGGAGVAGVATVAAVVLHQPLLWQPGVSLAQAATRSAVGATTISGLAAAGFFLAIVVGSEKILKKSGMGMGDVKLALFMGLFLGFPGIIVALYLAFIFGAVLSLGLLATKHGKMGTAIPFGPFLVIGTLLSLWLTPIIVTWYQNLLS